MASRVPATGGSLKRSGQWWVSRSPRWVDLVDPRSSGGLWLMIDGGGSWGDG